MLLVLLLSLSLAFLHTRLQWREIQIEEIEKIKKKESQIKCFSKTNLHPISSLSLSLPPLLSLLPSSFSCETYVAHLRETCLPQDGFQLRPPRKNKSLYLLRHIRYTGSMAGRLPVICPWDPAGQINRHGSRTGTRPSRVESKPDPESWQNANKKQLAANL